MSLIKPLKTIDANPAEKGVLQNLTAELASLYGGDFEVPGPHRDRPWTLSNFVISANGMVAFGNRVVDARYISRFNDADSFVMGLLRASADAIMMGSAVVRKELGLSFHYDIYEPAIPLYCELRKKLGKSAQASPIFVSGRGDFIDAKEAKIFNEGKVVPFIVTTPDNQDKVRDGLGDKVKIIATGSGTRVDLPEAMRILRHDYDVKFLLTEGGPTFFGQLLSNRLLDESFETMSDVYTGFDKSRVSKALREILAKARNGNAADAFEVLAQAGLDELANFPLHVIEGIAFTPETAPRVEIIGEKKWEPTPGFRYFRKRWIYPN